MKKIIILLMLLCSVCFSADKYVATTGNDTTGDGSPGNPYATILKGLDNVGDGNTVYVNAGTYAETTWNYLLLRATEITDGYTVTVKPWHASDEVILFPNSATKGSIMSFASAGTTFNFEDMVIDSNGTAYLVDIDNDEGCTYNFTRCTFNSVSGKPVFRSALTAGVPSRVVKFTDCTFNIAADPPSGGSFDFRDILTIEFDDCDFNASDSDAYFLMGLYLRIDKFYVHDCNFVGGSLANLIKSITVSTVLNNVIFRDNVVVGGSTFWQVQNGNVPNTLIEGNDITMAGTTGNMLHFGENEYFSAQALFINGVVVRNNNFERTAATTGHTVLFGTNTKGVDFSNNRIASANTGTGKWELVVKGDYAIIRDNIIKGSCPIYLNGSSYSKVYNNTLISDGGSAIEWAGSLINGGGTHLGQSNRVWNNILDGSGGTYAVNDLGDSGDWDNYFDYNLLRGGTALEYLNGAAYSTIATLQAKWLAWSDWFPLNDAHSIIGDPQFIDTTNYRPKNSNLRISADSYMGYISPVENKPRFRK